MGTGYFRKSSFLLTLGLVWLGLPEVAMAAVTFGNEPPEPVDGLTKALISGKPNIDARLRFERVDEDSTKDDDDVNATTLRTRFGYTTGRWYGFWVQLEGEDVTHVGDTTWFDTTNPEKQTTDPLVADPEGTEVNRIFIAFKGLEDIDVLSDTTVAVGRQRILLDNHRWVGNVGFRQNEQTFDAFRIDNTSLPNTHLFYSYVTRVHRIFGNNSQFEEFEGDFHFANLSYQFPVGTLTAYGYLLDFDDLSRTSFDEATLSANTYGARFTGSYDTGRGLTFLYAGEWATQHDAGDNPLDLDHDYYFLEGGVTFELGPLPVTAKAGFEVLEGDGTSSLQTPLATAHAFNGWADKFASAVSTNPARGLEDLYFLLGTSVWGVKLLVVYHDYDTEKGSDDYGREINVSASRKFGKHWGVGAKYANYDQDDVAPVSGAFDTEKFWVWVEFKFN